MEFEFDKEIDAILRKARGNENVFADTVSAPHLDADTLSAFAENALPESTKKLYTAHLADCDRCRRILSNLISLNAEAEAVPIGATAAAAPIAEAAIPWYRKLFFGFNPVYAMGALVVVFSAFTAYIVYQSSSGSLSSEVSSTYEKQTDARGPSASQESPVSASNTTSNATSVSNTAMSNTASTAANTSSVSTNATANTMPAAANTSAAAATRKDSGKAAEEEKSLVSGGESPEDDLLKSNRLSDEKPINKKEVSDAVVTSESKPEPKITEAQTTMPAPPAPKKVERDDAKLKAAKRSLPNAPPSAAGGVQTQNNESLSRRQIGGKTFRREGGAWIDSEYRQGDLLTNVSRGSNEYKKLDSGLRGIADRLDGKAIIVWKGKNYRIQ